MPAAGLPLEDVSTPGHGQGEGPIGDKWLETTPDTMGGAGVQATGGGRTEFLQGLSSHGKKIDEKLFRTVVKTAFNQRRKTLRNALKPILDAEKPGFAEFISAPVFDLRAERLSVDDFIELTCRCAPFITGNAIH